MHVPFRNLSAATAADGDVRSPRRLLTATVLPAPPRFSRRSTPPATVLALLPNRAELPHLARPGISPPAGQALAAGATRSCCASNPARGVRPCGCLSLSELEAMAWRNGYATTWLGARCAQETTWSRMTTTRNGLMAVQIHSYFFILC